MISAEQNDRLTCVGLGTPMGALMRRYWQPVAASSELAGAGGERLAERETVTGAR